MRRLLHHRCSSLVTVILSTLWLASLVLAFPEPVEHQAGISFTPQEDLWDDLANHPDAEEFEDAEGVLHDLQESYMARLMDRVHAGGDCTEDRIIVRKEWGDMSEDERRSFIDACKCLHNAPSQTPPDIAPGARNRWDDFVVAHLLHTYDVHRSPWLIPFHRELLYQLEKALRDECGYGGGLAYWDWPRYRDQPPEQWPMFDGSDTSLSGNGQANTPSEGCSCITDGPFADWKVNIGPVAGSHACTPNPQDDGLGFNERCLERQWDLTMLENLTYDNMLHSIQDMNEANTFNTYIEMWPLGLHTIPHMFVLGTQVDVPASPSDPWFFFHHSALDRASILWLYIDFDARVTTLPDADAYNDMRTLFQSPPAPAIGMDDQIQLSPIFEGVRVGDVLDPTNGRYCYRYD